MEKATVNHPEVHIIELELYSSKNKKNFSFYNVLDNPVKDFSKIVLFIDFSLKRIFFLSQFLFIL